MPERQPKSAHPGYEIPEWFLTNNVKTPTELLRIESNVHFIDKSPEQVQPSEVENVENVESHATQAQSPRYFVSLDKFLELRDTASYALVTNAKAELDPQYSSILINSITDGGVKYANSIMEHLARNLRATLICFDREDLEDLGADFDAQDRQMKKEQTTSVPNSTSENHASNPGSTDSLNPSEGASGNNELESNHAEHGSPSGTPGLERNNHYLDRGNEHEESSHESESEAPDLDEQYALANVYFGVAKENGCDGSAKSQIRVKRAISAILDAAILKNLPNTSGLPLVMMTNNRTPLFIFVRDASEILSLAKGNRFLAGIRNIVQERRSRKEPIVLFFWTTISSSTLWGYRLKEELHVKPPSIIAFEREEGIDLNEETNQLNKRINIARLKRELRTRDPNLTSSGPFRPCIDWDCGKIESVSSFLERSLLSQDQIRRAALQTVGRTQGRSAVQLEDISSVLARLDPHTEAKISAVESALEDPCEAEDLSGIASGKHEELILEFVIKPGKSDISYDDVIMGAETKTTIKQLLSIAASRATSASPRLLKLIQIMGVLLYGPPGTGKTHLCRAIASDSNQKLLAISAADVSSKWVGESEKIIKALFSIARKLFPCLIFIDEADTLFYRRSSTNRSWERTMLNQLLQEMDGLNTDSNSPVVIIATNRPMDLDEAFLRRFPHKVHFKLPSRDERCEILNLYLHHEDLESNVSVEALADVTERFSGSDLRNLCGQAALAWKIEQVNKPPKPDETPISSPKVLLSAFHLETALSRAAPSTSVASIDELKRFDASFNARNVKPNAAHLTSLKRKTPPQSTSEQLSEKRLKGEKSFDPENVDSGGTATPEAPNVLRAENAPSEQYQYKRLSIQTPETPQDDLKSNLWKVWGTDPQIRLLNLFPGKGSEELECSLQIVKPFEGLKASSQTAKYSYEAISYVWGDAKMRDEIICDGKTLSITLSLGNALRRVRHPDRERVLWADGICINQEDKEERGHQVILMAAIYSAAHQVLCWLGEDDGSRVGEHGENHGSERKVKHAQYTFDLARRLSNELQMSLDARNTRVRRATYVVDGTFDNLSRFTHDALEEELKIQSNIDHVQKFFENPWFYRMWIMQELGFASKALALCGDQQIDWFHLQNLSLWMVLRGPNVNWPGQVNGCSHFGDFYLKEKTFLELLVTSRQYHCSDPLDHIFALLAHPSAHDEIPFPKPLKDYTAGLRPNSDEVDEKLQAANIEKAHTEWSNDSITWMSDQITSRIGPNYKNNSGQPLLSDSDGLSPKLRSFVKIYEFSKGIIKPNSPLSQSSSPISNIDRESNSYSASAEVQDPVQKTGISDVKEEEIFDDNFRIQALHILSEKRKLEEYMDMRKHAVNRVASGSKWTCALSKPLITVDYDSNIDEVCFQVATKILMDSKELHLLSAVQHDPKMGLEDGAVSWVPRWDHPSISSYLGHWSPSRGTPRIFDKMTIPRNITLEEDTLTFPGFLVDTITSSTDLINKDTFFDPDRLLQFWATIPDLDSSSRAYSLEVYQRTLTAGNILSEFFNLATPKLDEEEVKSAFTAFWLELYDYTEDTVGSNISLVEKVMKAAKKGRPFFTIADAVCCNRRVFRTSKGYLGVGPGALQQDDVVSILPYKLPFVLRPTSTYYRLVGECYVDGIMEEEAMNRFEERYFALR